MADSDLERLLEELDDAKRRLETRIPLLEEAEGELQHSQFVILEGYLGFGRTIKLNTAARNALKDAIDQERIELKQQVEEARQRLIDRRIARAEI